MMQSVISTLSVVWRKFTAASGDEDEDDGKRRPHDHRAAEVYDWCSSVIKTLDRAAECNRYFDRLAFSYEDTINPYDEQLYQFSQGSDRDLLWWNEGSMEDLQEIKHLCRRYQTIMDAQRQAFALIMQQECRTTRACERAISSLYPVIGNEAECSDKEIESKMLALGRDIEYTKRKDIKQVFDDALLNTIGDSDDFKSTGIRRRLQAKDS